MHLVLGQSTSPAVLVVQVAVHEPCLGQTEIACTGGIAQAAIQVVFSDLHEPMAAMRLKYYFRI